MVETSVRNVWDVRAPLVVTGLPETVALLPGMRETVFLTLTNAAPILDEVSLQIEGLLPGWYTLPARRVKLLPRDRAELTLELHPPAEPPPLAGRYGAQLRVTSKGGDGVTLPLVLEVLPLEDLPAGGLEVALVPQVVTTKSVAKLTIELSTLGNHERVVDLEITDAALALRAELETDRVAVVPGETRKVAATVKLRRRPLLAPVVETPFEVVVRAESDDPSAGSGGALEAPLLVAPGTLIHKGPLAFVPGLVRGTLGWIVLGIALLIAVVAVVILLAPVVQEPTGPAPTPAPTAAPTPEPTAEPTPEATPVMEEPPPDLSGLPAEVVGEPSTAETPAATAQATPAASSEATPGTTAETSPVGTPGATSEAAPATGQATPAAGTVDVEATVQARVAATVAAMPSPAVAATQVPTAAPGASPPVAATGVATGVATAAATGAATVAPTAAPATAAPTAASTAAPTVAATAAPTTAPAAGSTAAATTAVATTAPATVVPTVAPVASTAAPRS